MAAEAPAALRAEEGCNPPPAIRPDTPDAGITAWAIIAGVIAEIIPGIIAEIIAAFTRPSFPCCKGRRIRLPGAAIHIDEKGLQNKQPETEITPCRSLFRRG